MNPQDAQQLITDMLASTDELMQKTNESYKEIHTLYKDRMSNATNLSLDAIEHASKTAMHAYISVLALRKTLNDLLERVKQPPIQETKETLAVPEDLPERRIHATPRVADELPEASSPEPGVQQRAAKGPLPDWLVDDALADVEIPQLDVEPPSDDLPEWMTAEI